MKKHPVLAAIIILVVVGLLVGISATDLWNYLIDFCSVAIHWFIAWLTEMIAALRDALETATSTAG